VAVFGISQKELFGRGTERCRTEKGRYSGQRAGKNGPRHDEKSVGDLKKSGRKQHEDLAEKASPGSITSKSKLCYAPNIFMYVHQS